MIRAFLVVIAIFSVPYEAGGFSAHQLPVVALEPGRDALQLKPFVRFTKISDGFDVEQDLVDITPANLSPIEFADIEFGIPDQPILVLLRVTNSGDRAASWIFTTDRASLRRIELFQIFEGEVRVELERGDLASQKRLLHRYHAFAYEISLAPGEERTLGVVFDAENSSRLPLGIQTERNHRAVIQSQANILLIASTATLTLILINGLIFFLTRRKPFLYFVLAELALLYQTIHQHGYTTIYLFSEYSELGRVFAGYAKVFFAIFSIKFARSFLRIEQSFPALDRFALYYERFCWIVIAMLSLYWLIPGLSLRIASYFSFGAGAMSVVLLPMIAIWAVYRYGRIYVPLILSWGIFGLFIVYTTLASINLVPGLDDHWRWFGPVGAIEAFFLSISLALDIRQIQNRQIESQTRLADEFRQRATLLEQANELSLQRDLAVQELVETGQLIASAGHDSRNFVGALKIYSHQMGKTENPEEIRDYAERIETIVDHLDHTIRLTMTQGHVSGESGKLCLETIDARSILDTVRLIHEQTARGKKIEIRVCAPHIAFATDRHKFVRIMGNLVSNAIKYANGGRILLSCRRQGSGIRFQVWDQGQGIAPERLAMLMEPGHRRMRLDPLSDGHGEGLNVVHQLCAAIGASLDARSCPGRGSVFQVEFPQDLSKNSGSLSLAIVDDPGQWPESVFDTQHTGVSYCFLTRTASVLSEQPDLLIVDPDFAGLDWPNLANGRYALASYDQSALTESDLPEGCELFVQKPVTRECVSAMFFLSQSWVNNE